MRECIETCDALFRRGAIFEVGNVGFYTGSLLGGVIRRAARGAVASTGWPASVNDADLTAGRAYATSLSEMAVEFFKANFPDYSWRHCFAAFDCSTKCLADRTRVRMVRRLAKKEGVCVAEAELAFKAALPHMARHFRDAGNDNRRAWQNYVEESLRERRGRPAIKASPVHHESCHVGVQDLLKTRHCFVSRRTDSMFKGHPHVKCVHVRCQGTC